MSNAFHRLLAALAVALLLWCGLRDTPAVDSSGARRAALRWIDDAAVRLHLTDSDQPVEALKPLLQSIDVITVGEVTHGTRECQTLRATILRAVASEHPEVVVALEASPRGARAIDDFIHGEVETALEAVRQLESWIWWTEEFVSLIEWMRTQNRASAGSRIRILGIDVGKADEATSTLRRIANTLPPLGKDTVLEQLRALDLWFESASGRSSPTVERRVADEACDAIAAILSTLKPAREAAWDLLEGCLAVSGLRYRVSIAAGEPSSSARDRTLANNVLAAIRSDCVEPPVIVLAHNLHAATAQIGSWRSMGSWLRESLGDDLLCVGFTTHSGRFNAQRLDSDRRIAGLTDLALPPVPEDSIEEALHDAAITTYALDLRAIMAGSEAGDWLLTERPFRTVGASCAEDRPEDAILCTALPKLFDILIHVDVTRPTRLLTFRGAPAAALVNPTFEDGLDGWTLSGTDPELYSLDIVPRPNGIGQCAMLASSVATPQESGNLKQAVDASSIQGDRVCLSAEVRAEHVEHWAGMWLVVLSPQGMAAMDNMSDRPIRGDMPWTSIEITLDIPEDATTLLFGLSLYGQGTVWMDDVTLRPGLSPTEDGA